MEDMTNLDYYNVRALRTDHVRFLIKALVEDFPDGYPRLAGFMASDINTRVYRRYGWERNRILLYKQDRVAELSDQLKALDRRDDRLQSPGLYSRRDDEELEPCQRPHLIRRLESELKEYDDILLREHAITSIPSPSRRTHKSVFDWIYNNKPVVRDEYQYLYQQDDFVLLGSQHDRWLWSFEEKIWALGHNPLFKVSRHALFPLYPAQSH